MTVSSCFSDACRRQAPSSTVSLRFYHHPPLLLPLPPLLSPLQLSPIIELGFNHEFDEIAQVVFRLDGPDEIPCRVKFLEEEWNRCFKTNDFADASIYYLSGTKLLCFSCIPSDADEALFKHLAISLNLNLAASELKQGKRRKAELGLHNVHKALCDSREAAQIEPNNVEIVKEFANVEREIAMLRVATRTCKIQKYLVNSACGGSPADCNRADEFGYNSAIWSSGSSSRSTTSVEGSKKFDHAISSRSPLMEVDGTLDVTFHLSRESNKACLQRSLRLSHSAYKELMHGRTIGYYDSRSMTYMAVWARQSVNNNLKEQLYRGLIILQSR
ncbi:LOW QUALITY PROTEIN: hypothetical protein Cgig2_031210 [Carnegiea gigantea]|uniref:Uncharacterized protein n=1 Tax=Carnegiea gigantea TaxID=171969 RepID=A0A9Q1GPU2_9CARY|nr:LOW QUALITY PROTEIN: hypothetical protein Cgig2_031210 [Carnegiea gigantea]